MHLPLAYGWDSRGRLASLAGAATAGFAYDAAGRRNGRTVNGTATNFLYDGASAVQELAGATPTANLLTGLGIDEVFTRTDSLGARTFVTDALGSTVALTDGSGAVKTNYAYEPYGNTTASGEANASTVQYTGRENDATGLYYYRNRYYSPTTARFIIEDPIGLAGGVNLYAYVGGNPVSFTDPAGLQALPFPITPVPGVPGGGPGAGGVPKWFADLVIGVTSAKPPANAYDPTGPKAPGKPGDAEGFCSSKGGDDWVKNPNGRGNGWRDADGNVWVPTGPYDPSRGHAHGGPRWDVQKPVGGYDNVYPGGYRR